MRILIAPDSFKGTLTSRQAAQAMAEGIRAVNRQADIRLLPMADGGEGTLDVLEGVWQTSAGLKRHVERRSFDLPSGAAISADYLILNENDLSEPVAIIESAQLIGMNLPHMPDVDIMQRGSGALGVALRALLDSGYRHIVVALGGSATNDGGLGMLMQLGMQAFGADGRPVTPDADGLRAVREVNFSKLLKEVRKAKIQVLCDVQAPLLGRTGASRKFGVQKGLSRDQCMEMDMGMAHYAGLCEQALGMPLRAMPGSGAAGGLGFAFALLGGELESGADYIMKASGIAQGLEWADWLVTGEGRSDAQTLMGKIPFRLAASAASAGVKAALISGTVDSGDEAAVKKLEKHFDRMIAVYGKRIADDLNATVAYADLREAAGRMAA